MNFSAYLIIRKESTRLKNKNFLKLGNQELYHWIIQALSKVDYISEILINTDCPELLLCDSYKKVKIVKRDHHLCGQEITANELIKSNIEDFKHDNIIMSHVTNPLLATETIIKALETYQAQKSNHDSLFTVNKMLKRCYLDYSQPINHQIENLEETQQLRPIFVENSCLYIFSKKNFKENKNRIGKSPLLFETPEFESLDIDTHNDWVLVQSLFNFHN